VSRSPSAPLFLLACLFGLFAGVPARGQDAARDVERALDALNKAFQKNDTEAIKRLMTADHVAVTAYYGRPTSLAEQIKSLKDVKLAEYKPGKVKVKMLGKGAALLTYPLTMKGTYKGKELPRRCFASAVWVRQGGRWREAFYQETALPDK
jgi:ketosteroid isomerase-like protein